MRKLLNTLFVTTEDPYLSPDGENVVVNREKQEIAQFPLHGLCSILSFSYAGASPALMGACVQRDINLAFCTPRGHFLAWVNGMGGGNVLLCRTQYRVADDLVHSCHIARKMIFDKLYNIHWSIEHTRRDHKLRIDEQAFCEASQTIQGLFPAVMEDTDMESLRGLEPMPISLSLMI